MSDLETRIAEWRRSLAVALGSDEIVDELESHLRDEIDQLLQTGYLPDAALTAAQAKLGQPTDLAAEYARAVSPEVWLPISFGVPLFILLFGYLAVERIALAIVHGYLLEGLCTIMCGAGRAVGLYTGVLGLCYFLCRLMRPISLGQRQSLRRSLLVANAGATLLLLIGVALSGMSALQRGGAIGGLVTANSLSLLWFATLTGMVWTNPNRLHLWVLLGVLTISINFWGEIGLRLLTQPIPAPRLPKLLWQVVVFTAVPLSVALLGLLPARRSVRRHT
jgi:hypothetical protein